MSIATEIARLQQAKADLKTAINAKGRAITDEPLDEYAAEVDAIVVGGGGTPTTGDFLVRFIDYDGTILKEEWVESGEDATPPTVPDHSTDCSGGGLTFQEWNNPYTNITRDTDVGATYITTDGKTHAFLKLTVTTTKIITLNLNKSDGSTLTVDWGDGTQNTYTNSGNFNTAAHTYSTYGDYEITLWISTGTGTYSFGKGSSTTAFLDGGSQEYALTKLFIGSNVITITTYGLYNMFSLKYITIPNTIVTIGNYSLTLANSLYAIIIPDGVSTIDTLFSSNFSLKEASLPVSLTTLGTNAFRSCFSLKTIYIPNNITAIGQYAFQDCYSLYKVSVPNGLLSIYDYAFRYCYSLKYINIGSSLKTIGSYAFYWCYALVAINLPATITSIATAAFERCYSLEGTLTINSTIAMNTALFNMAYSLNKVIFTVQCGSLYNAALATLYGVTEFDFSNCTTIPTMLEATALYDINKSCIIKVPLALEAEWKAATNWVTYADYIVGV